MIFGISCDSVCKKQNVRNDSFGMVVSIGHGYSSQPTVSYFCNLKSFTGAVEQIEIDHISWLGGALYQQPDAANKIADNFFQAQTNPHRKTSGDETKYRWIDANSADNDKHSKTNKTISKQRENSFGYFTAFNCFRSKKPLQYLGG